MRIDKNINIIYQNNDFDKVINKVIDKVIDKGDILTGKILDIKGKYLLLLIDDLGIINAISEKNLKPYIGKEMTFIVESLNEKIIKIRPNIDETNKVLNLKVPLKKEEYIENVFKEFNIEKTQLNKEYIKSLIEYSVKLDERNITTGISILKNIKTMLELHEEEIHLSNEYLGNEVEYLNIIKENIKENITESIKANIKENNQVENIKENNDVLENQLLEPKNDYNLQFKYLLKDKEISLLPKTIAFFIKYNVKLTLSNIKNFIELNLDIEHFLEDYEILKNIINKEFTNHYKNIIISNEEPKNLIEESRNIYLSNINHMLKTLKEEKTKSSKEIHDIFKRFENKLELIKELNNGLTFIYLPIDLNKDLNSLITLIKRKRNKYDYQDGINVFISLKTANLGKVEIAIKVINLDMKIEFSNLNKEDINYIKSKEEHLREILKSLGYNVTSIHYVDKTDFNILNILTVNSNPLYCLDVKV